MPNDIDKQIRNAIKAIIQPAYPSAVIWPYNALSHKLAEWPALLRKSDGKVHGWIIKRVALSAEWKTANRDRQHPQYDLWGFYGFRQGTETDNSDNEFGEICDTAYLNLKAAPNLNLAGIVERHDLLQFRYIATNNCGEETLHIADARLTVHLCC